VSDNRQMADLGKYASERFTPKVPTCGKSIIYLLFNGKELVMTSGWKTKKIYKYLADSGKPDQEGKFAYGKGRQKIRNNGPIPEEEYWINPEEFWSNGWYKFTSSQSAWGDYRITIHPYPNSNTFSRGGFFIHGGKVRGSAGCIDLTNNINEFFDDLKKEINSNTNCYIELKVKY